MPLIFSKSAAPRVANEFALDTTDPLSPDERDYAELIRDFFNRIAQDEVDDAAVSGGGPTPASVELYRAARAELVRKWSERAQEAIATGSGFVSAAHSAALVYGRYVERRAQVSAHIFDVAIKRDEKTQLARDLVLNVKPATGPNAPQPSEEARRLFVDIGATSAVFVAVHAQDVGRWFKFFSDDQQANLVLNEFVQKLEGVARIGLCGDRPELGALALADLRAQYMLRVARVVKIAYMRRLLVPCVLFGVAFAALYAWAGGAFGAGPLGLIGAEPEPFWFKRRGFFLLAAGSVIGAWLSFAIRRVDMKFAELATPESDLVRPFFRCLFVIGLSVLVGLLLWTRAIGVSMGDMQSFLFATNGSIALLIGAFCGLSERALATAIQGRSDAFVAGVGTGRPAG